MPASPVSDQKQKDEIRAMEEAYTTLTWQRAAVQGKLTRINNALKYRQITVT